MGELQRLSVQAEDGRAVAAVPPWPARRRVGSRLRLLPDGGVLYGLIKDVDVGTACRIGLAAAAESIEARSSHPDFDTFRSAVAERLGGQLP